VTAPYAVAVFNGKNVTAKPPKTEIWCMLYAQVKQADAKQNRNILLSEVRLQYVDPLSQLRNRAAGFLLDQWQLLKTAINFPVNLDAPSAGAGQWTEDEIMQLLAEFNLAHDTGLSILAVEMMPRYDQYIFKGKSTSESVRPLSRELGQYRILRTSPLVAAPEICCEKCA
jgi:hypothetical protein